VALVLHRGEGRVARATEKAKAIVDAAPKPKGPRTVQAPQALMAMTIQIEALRSTRCAKKAQSQKSPLVKCSRMSSSLHVTLMAAASCRARSILQTVMSGSQSSWASRALWFRWQMTHMAILLCRSFFDIGTVDQKKEIVGELYPKLLVLATETHGCRVIQKAIQHVPRESQLVMASKLKENVVACIESMHGNHVIQKCIEQMPPDSVTFIIEAVETEAQRMASHMYGCRVVQRLLEHCGSHQLDAMLNKILMVIDKLATDNYGNYVVQHMLEHGRLEDKRIIVGVIERNIVEFSKHKCSSNVVEKALEIATVGEHATSLENERSSLMFTIIGNPQDPNPPLRQMMEDRFGNFIVQRMIEHARGPERERLRQQLQASQDLLKNSSHGKHILNALKKENLA